ncbi:hypothetical protein ASPSYDRAFT_822038 [Aspergillus sydowii CBS 593.65]|uniref:RRM domain-containing protein n=1 Tax=Aspergillus sydowii CBS 593.65 TaxID=1036612 RepID=A0A1L9TPH8_9EURO|nr:uncharacterized protein ASPSYDRAFT_822038 [Aspergillus sydowii CBS 593.65]OJJ61331.1 hypothetical protein ASPSYDRAFT_822038 [Aspergillus sydowii CBS 593.65]
MCPDEDPIPPEYRPRYPGLSQAMPPPQTMRPIPRKSTASYHSHPPRPYYNTNYSKAPVATPLRTQRPNTLEGDVLPDISTQYDCHLTRVVIRNLPPNVDEETIRNVFKDIGSITVDIVPQLRGLSTAFFRFLTSDHAQQALTKNQQVFLKGRILKVKPYRESPTRWGSSATT